MSAEKVLYPSKHVILYGVNDVWSLREYLKVNTSLECGAHVVDIISCADIKEQTHTIELGGNVSAVVRFRTFEDIESLTFADVQDWNMEQFYYLEV